MCVVGCRPCTWPPSPFSVVIRLVGNLLDDGTVAVPGLSRDTVVLPKAVVDQLAGCTGLPIEVDLPPPALLCCPPPTVLPVVDLSDGLLESRARSSWAPHP